MRNGNIIYREYIIEEQPSEVYIHCMAVYNLPRRWRETGGVGAVQGNDSIDVESYLLLIISE